MVSAAARSTGGDRVTTRYTTAASRDDVRMNTGRVALLVTSVVVAGLGAWFVIARWDDANRIATVASALGAVAAVGVAVWAAVRTPTAKKTVAVSRTGKATAASGKAITGVSGGGSVDSVRVEQTGDAKATGGGDAVSGAELD